MPLAEVGGRNGATLSGSNLDHSGIPYASSVMGRMFSCKTWKVLDCSAVLSKKLPLDCGDCHSAASVGGFCPVSLC